MNKYLHSLCTIIVAWSLLAACAPVSRTPPESKSLTLAVLYPRETHTVEMGQSIKAIVKVLDAQGNPVRDAQVMLSVADSLGQTVEQVPAAPGAGDLYRTSAWTVPHKLKAGSWTMHAEAKTANAQGTASATFLVKNSLSEDLLDKYGFWIEAPAMKGITPSLVKEQGDARNGAIIWGGALPAAHIFVENWLEVQWREGNFKLSTPDQVRNFMLGTLGNIGFTPLRELGPFERVKFKGWDAWQVTARGEFSRYDGQWMIFYSPEANETYAISTTVVLPPPGIDEHAALREAFEVHPEMHANGVAPEPLPQLLPSPELIGPELGTRVIGADKPIVLRWQPLKELASDEYYQVSVTYNYDESSFTSDYYTRETELTLPASLYDIPNCGVFNWQVTLMQQTGIGDNGQLQGKPLSYGSLYWYVEWYHPLDKPAPFDPLCPNPQT